jgi:predicted patatin/cPLA2 family phospholipase
MDFKTENIEEKNDLLSLLKNRSRGKRDQKKIALVVEGGAMRGVIAAGAALALERLSLRNTFDAFYGTSAGAITASYFIARQATVGSSIFYDNLASRDFLDPRRFFTKEPIMNLDYLEEVLRERKPLHTDEVIGSDLSIFALNTETALVEKMPVACDRFDLLRQLRAACTMPFLCEETTEYQGKHYIDGGLNVSVPWKEALRDGATHIMILLTRPEDSPRNSLRFLERKLVGNNLARKNPDLVPLFLRRAEDYNENIEELRSLAEENSNISIVSPRAGHAPVSGFSRKRQDLVAGATLGAETLYHHLFGSAPRFREIITPVSHLDRIEEKSSKKSLFRKK